jgi:glyoxylase-like metal-dependent hydrolase (beta-lactamase superfamily II)
VVHRHDEGGGDRSGDLDRIKALVAKAGVTVEKLLITHGHIDHCGGAAQLARELGVPIEGPHEADLFWIAKLAEDSAAGACRQIFTPSAGWSRATR